MLIHKYFCNLYELSSYFLQPTTGYKQLNSTKSFFMYSLTFQSIFFNLYRQSSHFRAPRCRSDWDNEKVFWVFIAATSSHQFIKSLPVAASYRWLQVATKHKKLDLVHVNVLTRFWVIFGNRCLKKKAFL